MWDDELVDDDWEPLRSRRAGTIRIIALVIVAAMVVALVIPVALRLLSDTGDNEPEPQDRLQAHVVREERVGAIPA